MSLTAATYDTEGSSTGDQVELPADPFDGTVNRDALHQVVTAIRAHGRQGTHSTKTRSTITGGGRKPWRQKGTGRARHGSIRSPIWKGGAVVFGPHPRDYDPRVPKKLKRLAIRSALNARALEDRVVLVEPFELEAPRTRTVASFLRAVGAEGENVLILTNGLRRVVYLSARNLPGVMVKPWGEASAYDILWSDRVVVERDALKEADEEPEAGEETRAEAGEDR